MTCAWKELLAVLPLWLRNDVEKSKSEQLQEIRLRLNAPPELILAEKRCWLQRKVDRDDLHYIVNTSSKYSPWAAASVTEGYVTIRGGHRIGICGEVAVHKSDTITFTNYTSLCIRVACDYPDIAVGTEKIEGSVLILGPPGWGKTTLLRDMVRRFSMLETVCVVDERFELFPDGFDRGKSIDVLSGCPKRKGISLLLRTMGPSCIAVDEITDEEDTEALLYAANCGVRLLATAHGTSVCDLQKRRVYRSLLENKVFDVILMLRKDKTYTMERMAEWVTGGSVRY